MAEWKKILEDEDKLLQVQGHDFTKPHKWDALKACSIKIKSAPDGNTELALNQDIKRKDDGWEFAHKYEIKRKQGEFDFKWTPTNKDYEF